MVIGCVRVTDVSVINTIRSYGRRNKTFRWAACAERTAQGKDFELILTVKI